MNALEDEWRAACEEACRKQDADGLTSEELGDIMGVSYRTAIRQIRRLIRTGVMEYGGERQGLNIRKQPYPIPVYRMKPAEEEG